MLYKLWIITPTGKEFQGRTLYKEEEHDIALEDGAHWIGHYPEDIVMLEEVSA